MFTQKKDHIMTKPSSPLALRVSEDTKKSFASLKEESGMTTEDLTLGMIDAFKSGRLDGDNSPISAELKKVKQAFSTAERVVGAFLEIAESDKTQAIDAVNNQTKIFSEKISLLETEKTELQAKNNTFSEDNQELLKSNAELTSKLENTAALRDAWKSTEQGYKFRIAELDDKSKAIDPLSKENADLKSEVGKLRAETAELARVQDNLVKAQKLNADLESKSQTCIEDKSVLATEVAVADQKYSSMLEQLKTERASFERELGDTKETILILKNLLDNFKPVDAKNIIRPTAEKHD